jgi:hypothetical protein
VCPSASVAPYSVAGEGTHVGYMSKLMTFSTLSEDGGVAEADELASFAKHPYALFGCLFGDFTRMIHVCEHYCGVFPKVVGSTRVVGHLWDRNVSKNRVTSHFLDQGVRTSNVLLMVGGPNMSKLGPYPVAGRDDGTDFEVFQENVLELHDLFVGDGSWLL